MGYGLKARCPQGLKDLGKLEGTSKFTRWFWVWWLKKIKRINREVCKYCSWRKECVMFNGGSE